MISKGQRYSTSFGKVSDQLAEFYGHLREFPKIGTRRQGRTIFGTMQDENFLNKMETVRTTFKMVVLRVKMVFRL